jgi:hypothetical protein
MTLDRRDVLGRLNGYNLGASFDLDHNTGSKVSEPGSIVSTNAARKVRAPLFGLLSAAFFWSFGSFSQPVETKQIEEDSILGRQKPY